MNKSNPGLAGLATFFLGASLLVSGFGATGELSLEDAKKQWRVYRDFVSNNLECEIRTLARLKTPDGVVESEGSITLAQTRNCKLAKVAAGESEKLYCQNPKYRFYIERQNSSPAWLLKELHLLSGESARKGDLVQEVLDSSFDAGLCLRMLQHDLEKLVDSPDFTRRSLVRQGSHIILSCSFGYMNFVVSGDIKFLEDWRLSGCDLTMDNGSVSHKFTKEIRYDENELPLSIKQRQYDPSTQEVFQSIEADYRPSDTRNWRDSSFRLTNFGLPEPAGLKWSFPPVVWLGVLGLIAVGGVSWFRWRQGNRQSKS